MSKFGEFINSIKSRKKIKEEIVEKQKEEQQERSLGVNDNFSDQPEVKVTRVNKKLIYTIAGFIIVFIMSTVIFSNAYNTDNKKQTDNVEITPSQDGKKDKDNTSYSKLAAYEKQAKGNNTTKEVIGNNGEHRQVQESQRLTQQSTRIPQIRANNQSPVFVQNPNLLAMQQASQRYENHETNKAKLQPKEDSYSSSISFNISDSAQDDKNDNQVEQYETAENSLVSGTLIPAVIMNGINSELPGQVVAQVQTDVYDSLTDSTLLIPMGSKVVGTYTDKINNGQSRVNIKWDKLQLTDGRIFSLGDTCSAADEAGYAGIEGKVNNHTNKMLGATLLSSALGALSSIATGNNASTNNGWNNSNSFSQGAATGLISTADKFLEKNMNISPTIVVEPGTTFNIFVEKPVQLEVY